MTSELEEKSEREEGITTSKSQTKGTFPLDRDGPACFTLPGELQDRSLATESHGNPRALQFCATAQNPAQKYSVWTQAVRWGQGCVSDTDPVLTGILSEHCVGHEFEESLCIEAGSVY